MGALTASMVSEQGANGGEIGSGRLAQGRVSGINPPAALRCEAQHAVSMELLWSSGPVRCARILAIGAPGSHFPSFPARVLAHRQFQSPAWRCSPSFWPSAHRIQHCNNPLDRLHLAARVLVLLPPNTAAAARRPPPTATADTEALALAATPPSRDGAAGLCAGRAPATCKVHASARRCQHQAPAGNGKPRQGVAAACLPLLQCSPPHAAPGTHERTLTCQHVVSMLQDDGYIPADDASTLEFAADALEELANGVQPASSSEPGASLPSSDGAAANGVHAGATSEQDSDEDAGEEEEQEQAPAKKEKRKKKRKAAEAAEALEVGADEGAQQNGTGNTKKKRRKDKQG